MAKKNNYLEKLLDPRWQKKRLEVFERDEFYCRSCCNDKNTLHCHHFNYINGRDPWDYDNDNFITLCSECHKEISEKIIIAREALNKNYDCTSIDDIIKILEVFSQSNPVLPAIVLDFIEFYTTSDHRATSSLLAFIKSYNTYKPFPDL